MGLLEPGRRPHPADGVDAPRRGHGLTGSPVGPDGLRVRRIRPEEGPELRAIRLRAVLDAPGAFAGTIASVGAHPPSEWERRARLASDGTAETVLLAELDGAPVGMAGARTVPDEPSVRRIHGVWVEPTVRNRGVGLALLRSLLTWADAGGAEWTELWVADGNRAAAGLYRRLGFEETGRTRPFPPRPEIVEREYRRYRGAQPSRSSTV